MTDGEGLMLELPEDLETVRLERRGAALLTTLDRPDVRNALSAEMVSELRRLCALLAAEPRGPEAVRVLVLRGAGGNFSAGGDVRGMRESRRSEQGLEQMRGLNREFGVLLAELRSLPLVVIAAVEGAAMGGGMGLTCIGDVTIATADARLGTPEVTLGLVPAQIAPFLVERVGPSLAWRLMLTGGMLDAQQALRVGLVHEVVADAEALERRLAEIVEQVARCAPGAVARTKKLLATIASEPVDAVPDRAADAFVESVRDEAPEGIAAFLERRKPRWAEPGG